MTYNIDPYEYEYIRDEKVVKKDKLVKKEDPGQFLHIKTTVKPTGNILHITKKPKVNKYKKNTNIKTPVTNTYVTPSNIKLKKLVNLYDICSRDKAAAQIVKYKSNVNSPILEKIIDAVEKEVHPTTDKIKLPFANNKNAPLITVDPYYDYSYIITPSMIKQIEDAYLHHNQTEALDLITKTIADSSVTGVEKAVYKDLDGKLKTIDINKISELIFNTVTLKLVSNYDKTLDTSIIANNETIINISDELNDIDIWSEFNEN